MKGKPPGRLGLVLGTGCLVSSLVLAQVAQNRIEGRIQPPSGVRLPENISVNLNTVSGAKVSSVATSGSGTFTFAGLAAGKYLLQVQAGGFLPVQEMVEIPSGFLHNVVNVFISLTPQPAETSDKSKVETTVPLESLAVPKGAVKELAQAEKAAAQKKYAEAIEHAHKALELAPHYFEACNNLAVYHYQAGDKRKAVEIFHKALSMNERAAGTHANLGRVYLELSRPDLAVEHLRRAAELDPSTSVNHYHLGRAYILAGQFLLSEDPLRQALEHDPPVPHARFLLAHVLYELGRKSEAVRELELYLQTKPPNRDQLKKKLAGWKAEVSDNSC